MAIFLATNITCSIVVRRAETHSRDPGVAVTMVRVVINDTLFLFCGIALAYLIYRMSKMTAANMVLEAKV